MPATRFAARKGSIAASAEITAKPGTGMKPMGCWTDGTISPNIQLSNHELEQVSKWMICRNNRHFNTRVPTPSVIFVLGLPHWQR